MVNCLQFLLLLLHLFTLQAEYMGIGYFTNYGSCSLNNWDYYRAADDMFQSPRTGGGHGHMLSAGSFHSLSCYLIYNSSQSNNCISQLVDSLTAGSYKISFGTRVQFAPKIFINRFSPTQKIFQHSTLIRNIFYSSDVYDCQTMFNLDSQSSVRITFCPQSGYTAYQRFYNFRLVRVSDGTQLFKNPKLGPQSSCSLNGWISIKYNRINPFEFSYTSCSPSPQQGYHLSSEPSTCYANLKGCCLTRQASMTFNPGAGKFYELGFTFYNSEQQSAITVHIIKTNTDVDVQRVIVSKDIKYTAGIKRGVRQVFYINQTSDIRVVICDSVSTDLSLVTAVQILQTTNPCTEGYYFDYILQVCQPCRLNCLQCTNQECFQCADEYLIASNNLSCELINPPPPIYGCTNAQLMGQILICFFCDMSLNLVLETSENLCKCKMGFEINPSTGLCQEICPDGVRNTSQCDDSNSFNNDGCDQQCNLQEGFVCDTEVYPTTCNSTQQLLYGIESINKSEDGIFTGIIVLEPLNKNLPFAVLKDNFMTGALNLRHLGFKIVLKQDPFQKLHEPTFWLQKVEDNKIMLFFEYEFTVEDLKGRISLDYSQTRYSKTNQTLEFVIKGSNGPLKHSQQVQLYQTVEEGISISTILIMVGMFVGLLLIIVGLWYLIAGLYLLLFILKVKRFYYEIIYGQKLKKKLKLQRQRSKVQPYKRQFNSYNPIRYLYELAYIINLVKEQIEQIEQIELFLKFLD